LTAASHPIPKSAGDRNTRGAASETSQIRRLPPEASPKTMEELSFGHVPLLEDMSRNQRSVFARLCVKVLLLHQRSHAKPQRADTGPRHPEFREILFGWKLCDVAHRA